MVDISRHIDFLGPSGKTLSVSERSGLQVGLQYVAGFLISPMFSCVVRGAVCQNAARWSELTDDDPLPEVGGFHS